jgi:rubredoxin
MMLLSRRHVLHLLGGLGAAAGLAGCTVKVEETTEEEAEQEKPADTSPAEQPAAAKPAVYKCGKCGYVYDPAKADPPTPFEDLPDDWKCPKCGAPKSRYKPVE